MDPFTRLDYETARIEERIAPFYEEELRLREEAREVWGGIRKDLDQDLERALIQPYEGDF